METILDESVFPLLYEGSTRGDAQGMTLRDHFAATIQDEPGDNDYSDETKAELVGKPCPSFSIDGAQAILEFEADFRAKWRFMRADAMIRARGAA